MLGILWKDLKVMRMQTAILTSIFSAHAYLSS